MDYYIDVIIPESKLVNCELEEEISEWGGEIIHKIPREYRYCGVKMIECAKSKYAFDIEDSIELRVLSSLHDVEADCNIGKNDIEDNEIFHFIDKVTKLSKFVIIIGMYDETIDDVLNYSEEVNLRDVFLKTFNWNESKGIIIKSI